MSGQRNVGGSSGTEMQPFLTNAAPATSVSAFLSDRLAMLTTVSQISIKEDGKNVTLLDSGGRLIFKCDTQERYGGGRGSVGGSATNFILSTGQTVFTTIREEFGSRTTVGDIVLGKVEGDFCGCSRYFAGELLVEPAGGDLEFRPTDTCSSTGFSCFNYCCIGNYEVYSGSGNLIGKISSTGGTKISFTNPDISVNQKALIVSATLLMYELYFAPRPCGNVGEMGCRCLTVVIICLIAILLGIIAITIVLVKKGTSTN